MVNVFKKLFLLLLVGFLLFGFKLALADEAPPVDTTPPVLTLLGEANMNLNLGDNYLEAGATALDETDGDLTANIVINGLVDTTTVGNYVLSYNVTDAAGNSAVPLTRNVSVNALPAPAQQTFIIRNGDSVIWQGSVPLPNSGAVSINDSLGIAHSVNAQSVLALLYSIDQTSESFSISNLTYYDSFGSFYLKCLDTSAGELCDNWQYAVGTTTPWQSIDQAILSGDNTVGIFFGSPHKLTLSSSEIRVGNNLLVRAEKYNYLDNSWSALGGVSVGVTLPNPADPWSPQIITTQSVNDNGEANFTINEANTYNLGIVEDYYFPSYQLIVSLPVSGGGGFIQETPVVSKVFDIDKALVFLEKNQAEGGSFAGAGLYTDWAAIAYGAAGVKNYSRDLLMDYLKNKSKLSSNLTDNERRAMALLALGENPYDFSGINYIEAIVNKFDGNQFGDVNLINDDIFALIPLLSSGYTKDDEIIKKSLDHILSQQSSDGSWNSSVDLSAAAIQLLVLFDDKEIITQAINKAEQYIVTQQKDDGGFDSVYSTSWAEQSRVVIKKTWEKNKNTPIDYLANQQSADGGMLVPEETLANRIWSTSYAIPAALGKSWHQIFIPVQKPTVLIKDDLLPVLDVMPQIEDTDSPEEVLESSEEDQSSLVAIKTELVQSLDDSQDLLQKDLISKEESLLTNETDQSFLPQTGVSEDKKTPTEDNTLSNSLPLIAGVFIVLGGLVVAKFWF